MLINQKGKKVLQPNPDKIIFPLYLTFIRLSVTENKAYRTIPLKSFNRICRHVKSKIKPLHFNQNISDGSYFNFNCY